MIKIEKNKIVFASVLVVVVIFLVSYTLVVMGGDKHENKNLKETSVPELKEDLIEYDSKLDAINNLREMREVNIPRVYDQKMIDRQGYYDPDLPSLQKQRIIDSIYDAGKIQYSERRYQNFTQKKTTQKIVPETDTVQTKRAERIKAKELGLEHQLFFASNPDETDRPKAGVTDPMIYAVVDGDQVVKKNSRLRMRLSKEARINGNLLPKNTIVYGFIRFQPNRVLIDIENIQHQPTKLKAFDLQDGSNGIYVENNFRAEVTNEVVGDMVDDINIAGVPQVSGFKKIFQRNHRNVKVTVLNNYKLILKPKL